MQYGIICVQFHYEPFGVCVTNGGISMSLKSRIRNSDFVALLDWQEDDGKGRRCILLSAFISTVVNAKNVLHVNV